MRRRSLIAVALILTGTLLLGACGDDDGPDFTTADLERLNFTPDDLPEMEYQADSSGQGAFRVDQEQEAEEEGDESGVRLVEDLDELGLEEDFVSQFFAFERGSELGFIESITFLFEDEAGAEDAVEVVRDAAAKNIAPAEEIEAPELGEQPFGLSGEFEGFPTYTYGWRVGDVIQLFTAAPNDQKAGPEGALELAEQLEAKAQE